MNALKSKTELKTALKAFLVWLAAFLSIAIAVFFLLKSNETINSKQGLSEIENCVLDLSDCQLENRYVKQHMVGEYEFFYNKWIVEENYQGEPDAIVEVPHHFKDTILDGKRLSNEGYASYRVTLKGLKKGLKIYFLNNNFVGGCYGYVNNRLIYQYGTHQKTGESKSNGGAEVCETYVVENEEPLEIVFEISSSKMGGLYTPPRLMLNNTTISPASPSLTNNIGFIVLGVTFSLFIFSFIINIGISAKRKDFSFVILMLVIMLLTVFSIAVYWRMLSFLRFYTYNIIVDVNFFANFALIMALYLHLIKINLITFKKQFFITLTAVNAVTIILYFALMGTFWQIIPFAIQCLLLLSLIYPIAKTVLQGKYFDVLYILLILNLALYVVCTSFDMINLTMSGFEQSIAYVMFPICLLIIIIYRNNSVENSKKLISALEAEKEHNTVKAEALKAQIKPHFIFNSLSNIQSAYEKDQKLGEKALTMFSKHLRANVDSNSVETVPFSVELDNIMNYIELENMRREKPINILLDCEDVEFNLPILSLQPFIENAFKYSKVENKKDGYVEIKTYETSQYYYVEINDNGVGFFVKQIKDNSVGLKNAKERLKLLSNAEVEIKSKIDSGTKILIKFPKNN